MIARRRTRARLVASPGGAVAIAELLCGAGGIRVVACREDFAGNRVEQLCGGFGAGIIRAVGDVARADEDGIAGGRERNRNGREYGGGLRQVGPCRVALGSIAKAKRHGNRRSAQSDEDEPLRQVHQNFKRSMNCI